MKITAVLSDLGMVHVHYDDPTAFANIGWMFGVSGAEVEAAMWREPNPLGPALSRGDIMTDDFPDELARRIGKPPLNFLGQRVFRLNYCAIFSLVPQVDRLYRQLKRNGIALAAVSNIDFWRHDWLKRQGWLNLYDEIVVSHEERLLKPSSELMVRTLDRLGVPAEATLFVDDRPENLVPAAALGIKTHAFVGPRQLRRKLRSFGLL